ncbi:MAG: DUF2164 domain-containing protein [Clostridiales bacterium]|nr:DUF2164 domain-containing protein [Clostridiales bacterium]
MYSFKEEEKKQMQKEIAYFFKEEYELDLGIIGTEKIFEFFKEVMGNHLYNLGLDDAKSFYQQYAGNMETDYYSLYRDIK